jgi:ribosomal protein L7/L12
MKYELAYGDTEKALVAAVARFLQRGWEPVGGIAVASDGGLLRFVQAMVAASADAEVPEAVPALWEMDVRAEVMKGRKINAIKIVRENTGLGLKEAKDFVEALGSYRYNE